MKRLIGVGVGPGDPELVTVKAVRVLREADVVLVPVLAATDLAAPATGAADSGRASCPPSPAGPRRSSARTSPRAGSSAWSSR